MSTTTTDPIADMLTRIRNAIAVHKTTVSLPYSRIKESVAELLKQNQFIDNVKVEGDGIEKTLLLTINREDSNSKITSLVRLSKPGRRHYSNSDSIPTVMRGRGLVIISTSKGIMTGQEAKKLGVGGELICKVY